jgi:hypothetical protein
MSLSLMAILGVNHKPFKEGLHEASGFAHSFGEQLQHVIGENVSKIASVYALERAMEKTLEYAEVVRVLSIRTGQSTEQIQKWDYASSRAHVELETLIKGFEKFAILQAKAKSGDPAAFGALQRLGLSKEQIGDLSAAASNFETVGHRIKDAAINGQLLKDVTLAFGKTGREIIPVFKMDIKELGEEIKRLGGIMTPKAISEGVEAAERMKLAWFQIRPLVGEVTAFMARRVMEIADFFRLSIGVMIVDLNARSDATKPGSNFWDRTKENWHGQKDAPVNVDKIAADARNKYIEKVAREREEREKQLAKMEAELKRGTQSGVVPYGAESPELQEATKVMQLKERLFNKQQQNDLESLSREGQILELTKRRADIEMAMRLSKTEEGQLNAKLDMEDIDSKLRGLKVSGSVVEEKKSEHRRAAMSVNNLQRIGAFAANPIENIALSVHKQSAGYLRKIEQHLAKPGGGGRVRH